MKKVFTVIAAVFLFTAGGAYATGTFHYDNGSMSFSDKLSATDFTQLFGEFFVDTGDGEIAFGDEFLVHYDNALSIVKDGRRLLEFGDTLAYANQSLASGGIFLSSVESNIQGIFIDPQGRLIVNAPSNIADNFIVRGSLATQRISGSVSFTSGNATQFIMPLGTTCYITNSTNPTSCNGVVTDKQIWDAMIDSDNRDGDNNIFTGGDEFTTYRFGSGFSVSGNTIGLNYAGDGTSSNAAIVGHTHSNLLPSSHVQTPNNSDHGATYIRKSQFDGGCLGDISAMTWVVNHRYACEPSGTRRQELAEDRDQYILYPAAYLDICTVGDFSYPDLLRNRMGTCG